MAATRARYLRWTFWAIVLGIVGAVGWSNRVAVVEGIRLLGHAHFGWLMLALGAIGLLYLFRSFVYRIPLTLLGYTVPRTFLWEVAVIASATQQLVPSGGASAYAFLTYALHRRGVSAGRASLIALIDTISYAFAAGTLVIIALIYIGLTGALDARSLLAFAPGTVLAALAVWVYRRQRDRAGFIRLVLRLQKRMARLLGARWPEAPVRDFLDEYYRGKAVLARHRGAFLKMIGLQYLAVGCDAGAVYLTFLAVGAGPSPVVIFLAFVLSMAAGTVVSAPAGGGSFELVMSATLVRHGMESAQAVAGTLLFRLVSLWAPVMVSGVLLLDFRRRRKEIRREASATS